ncbi:response regulator [Siculibacillus lacustris]|uniref:response regulator n=1 Tax=Siculibacillus lacustris TaxID=1549641 RepID=UPI001D18A922|nr:response regulator [Siculibacillus lacustris]
MHVLEDDPGVADSLRFVLQAHGLDVVLHPDAESFFEASPPGAADAVIVDLGLPGIGGAQVIRWLARLSPMPRIVAITGQTQKAIDGELRDLPPVQLLRKPLSAEALTALLETVEGVPPPVAAPEICAIA